MLEGNRYSTVYERKNVKRNIGTIIEIFRSLLVNLRITAGFLKILNNIDIMLPNLTWRRERCMTDM